MNFYLKIRDLKLMAKAGFTYCKTHGLSREQKTNRLSTALAIKLFVLQDIKKIYILKLQNND